MLMTPGVGLFYGGLVRRKNIVSMIALSFVAFALISLMWVLFGYSLAFGSDIGGVIGGLDFLGLNGVGLEPYGPTTVPALTFALFQMMFATVTLAILTSVFAERAKLSAFIVFGLLWVTLVYVPVAHWIWGGGWLASLGAVDFAGGAVVHRQGSPRSPSRWLSAKGRFRKRSHGAEQQPDHYDRRGIALVRLVRFYRR
jgi:Amt family ammonium transporter